MGVAHNLVQFTGRIKFLLGEFYSALEYFDCAMKEFGYALDSSSYELSSILFDQAIVKCLLAKYLDAVQDINKATKLYPNNEDIKRFQACLEDILYEDSSDSLALVLQYELESSKSSTAPLQLQERKSSEASSSLFEPPRLDGYDLLTEDGVVHRSEKWLPFIMGDLEKSVFPLIPDWTEVREPSEDQPELDFEQETSYNGNFPQLLQDYLNLYGLTGYDSLCTGEKLAEGGQADIFEALGTTPGATQTNLVLKVFKQAFPSHTSRQLDVFHFGGVYLENPSPFLCVALGVKFLDDGRCAFVFPRHWGDLRHLIHRQILVTPSPFGLRTSVKIMLQIAEGMRSLHIRNILHRDLKASNVLVTGDNPDGEDFRCMVADFECSLGVMGTGFWRAPEILSQLKQQSSEPRALAWSKEADVYSFGMLCYEILTGCAPFTGIRTSDWDVILSGNRPKFPPHHNSKLRRLIDLCWHPDPHQRPNFWEICKVLANLKGNAVESLEHVQTQDWLDIFGEDLGFLR